MIFKDSNSTEETKREDCRDMFINLCFRTDNLAFEKPGLVAKALFVITERSKGYADNYDPSFDDFIESVEYVETLLDQLEELYYAPRH